MLRIVALLGESTRNVLAVGGVDEHTAALRDNKAVEDEVQRLCPAAGNFQLPHTVAVGQLLPGAGVGERKVGVEFCAETERVF